MFFMNFIFALVCNLVGNLDCEGFCCFKKIYTSNRQFLDRIEETNSSGSVKNEYMKIIIVQKLT